MVNSPLKFCSSLDNQSFSEEIAAKMGQPWMYGLTGEGEAGEQPCRKGPGRPG